MSYRPLKLLAVFMQGSALYIACGALLVLSVLWYVRIARPGKTGRLPGRVSYAPLKKKLIIAVSSILFAGLMLALASLFEVPKHLATTHPTIADAIQAGRNQCNNGATKELQSLARTIRTELFSKDPSFNSVESWMGTLSNFFFTWIGAFSSIVPLLIMFIGCFLVSFSIWIPPHYVAKLRAWTDPIFPFLLSVVNTVAIITCFNYLFFHNVIAELREKQCIYISGHWFTAASIFICSVYVLVELFIHSSFVSKRPHSYFALFTTACFVVQTVYSSWAFLNLKKVLTNTNNYYHLPDEATASLSYAVQYIPVYCLAAVAVVLFNNFLLEPSQWSEELILERFAETRIEEQVQPIQETPKPDETKLQEMKEQGKSAEAKESPVSPAVPAPPSSPTTATTTSSTPEVAQVPAAPASSIPPPPAPPMAPVPSAPPMTPVPPAAPAAQPKKKQPEQKQPTQASLPSIAEIFTGGILDQIQSGKYKLRPVQTNGRKSPTSPLGGVMADKKLMDKLNQINKAVTGDDDAEWN